jgi:hypothetical protein
MDKYNCFYEFRVGNLGSLGQLELLHSYLWTREVPQNAIYDSQYNVVVIKDILSFFA